MSDAQLQKYFEFDEADLFANRTGALSNKQRKRLVENARAASKLFLIVGIVIMVIGVGVSLIPLSGPADVWFLVIWGVIWTGLGLFFGISLIRWGRPGKNDLTVCKAEGPVNIVKEETYNSTMKQNVESYELHSGGVTFDVEGDLADVMMQGDTYAIYYTEGLKEILSVEELRRRK